MSLQVALPEDNLPAYISFLDRQLTDDEYFDFCMSNPDLFLERTAEGEIVILPPPGFETDYRNVLLTTSLFQWAQADGRGRACGPTAHFKLRTGAFYSPNAGWVSNTSLARLTPEQKKKFPPLCPEFVVELMSPSDRLAASKRKMQDKMQEWMRAGVDLAWLIHADKRTVYVYRAGQPEPETHAGITELKGEDPVEGFTLDLADIWAGV